MFGSLTEQKDISKPVGTDVLGCPDAQGVEQYASVCYKIADKCKRETMKRKSLLLWRRCRGTRQMRFLQIKRFDLINLIHRKRSPFSMGEGSGERSLVWVADGSSICDRRDLGSSRTSTPTSEIEIFVSTIDGCAFCNRNELGQSATCCIDAPVPTSKKDNRYCFVC